MYFLGSGQWSKILHVQKQSVYNTWQYTSVTYITGTCRVMIRQCQCMWNTLYARVFINLPSMQLVHFQSLQHEYPDKLMERCTQTLTQGVTKTFNPLVLWTTHFKIQLFTNTFWVPCSRHTYFHNFYYAWMSRGRGLVVQRHFTKILGSGPTTFATQVSWL